VTRILVVEDEFITATDITQTLGQMGFTVPAVVDNGNEAIAKAGELFPDLILMDITLGGEMTGIEAARRIRELYHIPIIFLTAHSEHTMVEQSLSSSPFGYIIKPFDPSDLRVNIEMALSRHGMEEKLRESEQTIRSLLNAVPDALLLLDGERRIIALNEPMAGILGGNRIGEPVGDQARNTGVHIPARELELVYRAGVPSTCEEEVEGRWFEISLFPMKDEHGQISRVAVQTHDVTDLKFIEEAMKREGISRIERNMEQFMILNDRIRNPLQVIRSCLELGGEIPFRSRIEEQVGIIDSLVDQLDRGWVESEKVRMFLMRHYRIPPTTGPGEQNPGLKSHPEGDPGSPGS
jgi:two-component system, response regulator PdtaR